MSNLPEKLSQDAIYEALCEFRFDSSDPPELLMGRLTNFKNWNNFNFKQLPASQMPSQLREANSELRYQATIEGKDPDKNFLIKIGHHVLSIHYFAPYPGWDVFKEDIKEVAEHLFEVVSGINVIRLGLRYVNFFTSNNHGISSINDLAIKLQMGTEKSVNKNLNLIHIEDSGEKHRTQTRIATGDIVFGAGIPENMVAMVDIDVVTPADYQEDEVLKVIEWATNAHGYEKRKFFELLPKDLVEKLM